MANALRYHPPSTLPRMLAKFLRQAFRRRRDPLLEYSAAYRSFEAGRLEEAKRACAGLAYAPQMAGDVLYLRALVAERRADLAQAAALCRLAAEAKPAEPLFRLALAKWLLELGHGTEAAAQF